jgi:riboflavin kinase/FMN adenylyltransferase
MIYSNLANLPAAAHGHVIAIGNFDGVHLGHQRVIAAAAEQAATLGTQLSILSFSPNPRQFFQPDAPPSELMPIHVRARYLKELGINHLYVQQFDAEFSRLSPEQFLKDILQGQLHARHIVVGENFHFGYRRAGNIDYLRANAEHYGITVTAVQNVTSSDGIIYSSTNVRELLTAGDVRDAAKILGRPHEIEGPVEQGAGLARAMGFPTANMTLHRYHRPRYGVYAVRVLVEGYDEQLNGVANLGVRPTLDGLTELFEVHLFDFNAPLYGRTLRVELLDFIRPEHKFPSLDALKAQISLDVEAAKLALAGFGC